MKALDLQADENGNVHIYGFTPGKTRFEGIK